MLELAEEKPAERRADWNDKIRIVELQDWGPQLPTGTVDPATGALQKDMQNRRWNLRREKEIGKLRDENRKQNMAQLASKVLVLLYSQLGSLSLSGELKGKSFKRELLSISQLAMGDVLHAYVWLRREFIGPDVPVNLRCTHCGEVSKNFQADLNTLDIYVADSVEDTYWIYELAEPFEIRGKPAEKLRMRQARWCAVETSGGGLNVGAIKADLILASIDRVEGIDNIVLTEHELEEMGKRDVEQLTHLIDKRSLGPDMSVEAECPSCRGGFRTAIDWSYDSFFGVSGSTVP